MCSLRWPCTRYNSTGTAAVCRVRTSDQDRPSTFTWSYRRLPSPTPSPPHKSQAKAKPGPLSVPSDSLPPLSSSSPTHPAIPLPPSTRGVEALGSRQQAARRSHPPNQPPQPPPTSSSWLLLVPPCSSPKGQEPTRAKTLGLQGEAAAELRGCHPAATPNSNVLADENLRHLPTYSRQSSPLGFSSSSWWAPNPSLRAG